MRTTNFPTAQPRSNPTKLHPDDSEGTGKSSPDSCVPSPFRLPPEGFCKEVCEKGGGKFIGFFESFQDVRGFWIEPLVLFDSPYSKSTLALAISEFGISEVREKIAASDAKFSKASNKSGYVHVKRNGDIYIVPKECVL
jgi:hypothetical protein